MHRHSNANINNASCRALYRHTYNMKSTFIGAILFAVAIVNQVSAIEYVNKATYDKYEKQCKETSPFDCESVPYCESYSGT